MKNRAEKQGSGVRNWVLGVTLIFFLNNEGKPAR
jgi:hypothetical protein